jgi:hypothetical protein
MLLQDCKFGRLVRIATVLLRCFQFVRLTSQASDSVSIAPLRVVRTLAGLVPLFTCHISDAQMREIRAVVKQVGHRR